MNEINLNSEALGIIVQTYQKINELKRLFNKTPFLEIKKLVDCGDELNKMMNETTKEISSVGFELKLQSLSLHVSNLSSYTEHLQSFEEEKEIVELLSLINTNISIIKKSLKTQD